MSRQVIALLLPLIMSICVLAKEEQNFYKSRQPLALSGSILSGLLVGFFVLLILIIGLSPLLSIKTPQTFSKHPLAVGKEN